MKNTDGSASPVEIHLHGLQCVCAQERENDTEE